MGAFKKPFGYGMRHRLGKIVIPAWLAKAPMVGLAQKSYNFKIRYVIIRSYLKFNESQSNRRDSGEVFKTKTGIELITNMFTFPL